MDFYKIWWPSDKNNSGYFNIQFTKITKLFAEHCREVIVWSDTVHMCAEEA